MLAIYIYIYTSNLYTHAHRFFSLSRKIKSFLFSKCYKFYFLICVDDIIRQTNVQIHIHEQKTEKCVFERRLIVYIKDRRKKERERERRGANAKKEENTCTKKILISVEMGLVAVVVVVAEKKIEMVWLAIHLKVFALDLMLNLFVLCKLVAVVLKNLLLKVLLVYVMWVDLVLVVAL